MHRKRVQRLVRQMGLRALYPKPRTSQPGVGHAVYPYLLRGLSIERPNQVWVTDICYIPMAHGFMYLVAILDWYSRRVLAWRVSNTFDSDFCVEALEAALTRYGPPEIFNTDQGAQGEFNWSSQHLDDEVLQCRDGNGEGQTGRVGLRCVRLVGRR